MDPFIELEKILRSPIAIEQHIKSDLIDKEIILYGAGSMGKMALNLMHAVEIKPSFFADQIVTGKLNGLDILPLSLLSSNQKKNSLFVICVVTTPNELIAQQLHAFGCENLIHFYDYSELFFSNLMGNGWYKPILQPEEIDIVKRTLKSLVHDNQSIASFLRYLWWRLRRVNIQYKDFPVKPAKKYFQEPSFPSLGEAEVFVDGGAHHGELSIEFIKTVNNIYSSIHAFEPDKKNYEILVAQKSLRDVRVEKYKLALAQDCSDAKFIDGMGYASKIDAEFGNTILQSVNLDSLDGIHPTIIKLHLEGGEFSALLGAKECIDKYRPIIMVVADHNQDGVFSIPEYLMQLKDYKLYFTYSDFCGNTSIFYAYPAERIEKV